MKKTLLIIALASALSGDWLLAQPGKITIPLPDLVPILPSTTAIAVTTKTTEALIDDGAENTSVPAEYRGWLLQRRFADLEARAQELLRTGARNHSGSWLLEGLFFGMNPEDKTASEAEWQNFQRLHESWRAATPQPSAVQIVAEARFWVAYAWKARGIGMADTVTTDGWKLMAERLTVAERLLRQNWALVSTVPAAYMMMATVALGQGWPRPQRDELFAEGRRKFPDYYGIYFSEAMQLMPRWYGEPGELARWAWDVTAGQPDDFRHEIYARIAWSQMPLNALVLKDPGFDWPKVRAGFEVLRAKWPQSGHILNRYARLSWQALDRETALRLQSIIGDMPCLAVWGNQETYENFRRWVVSPPQRRGAHVPVPVSSGTNNPIKIP